MPQISDTLSLLDADTIPEPFLSDALPFLSWIGSLSSYTVTLRVSVQTCPMMLIWVCSSIQL